MLFLCLLVTWQNVSAGYQNDSDVQQIVSARSRDLQNSTVRIRSGSDVSSGVLISKSGLILSVAHGLKSASKNVLVILPSGQTCEASPVFVDERVDVALLTADMQSLKDVQWQPLSLSATGQADVGDVVIASGFPARERDGLNPVVRLGQIHAADKSLVLSSCKLTSGDSGGPLVNSRGELVGLHQQIGKQPQSNGHVSLDVIRDVLKNHGYEDLFVRQAEQTTASKLVFKQLDPSPASANFCQQVITNVFGSDANGEPRKLATGTVLNERQVATKLSEVISRTDLRCRFASGLEIVATLKMSDRGRDLAILELAHPYPYGDKIRATISTLTPESYVGQIILAVVNSIDSPQAGLISRVGHDEESVPARFGAEMSFESGKVRIVAVTPNGSAVLAGLMAGDTVLSIDAKVISSLQDVADILETTQPGDWLRIEFQRGSAATSATVPAQLQYEPGTVYEKTEFLDGRAGRVSLRRSGFKGLLQYDVALQPEDCGGPLLDLEGRLIGINIARRARESTLAIPIADVLALANGQ